MLDATYPPISTQLIVKIVKSDFDTDGVCTDVTVHSAYKNAELAYLWHIYM